MPTVRATDETGAELRPQTGFRMGRDLKAAAKSKAAATEGVGTLNAAVEQLLQAWVDGTVALPTVATVFGLRLTALRLDLHVPRPGPKDEDSPSTHERG